MSFATRVLMVFVVVCGMVAGRALFGQTDTEPTGPAPADETSPPGLKLPAEGSQSVDLRQLLRALLEVTGPSGTGPSEKPSGDLPRDPTKAGKDLQPVMPQLMFRRQAGGQGGKMGNPFRLPKVIYKGLVIGKGPEPLAIIQIGDQGGQKGKRHMGDLYYVRPGAKIHLPNDNFANLVLNVAEITETQMRLKVEPLGQEMVIYY